MFSALPPVGIQWLINWHIFLRPYAVFIQFLLLIRTQNIRCRIFRVVVLAGKLFCYATNISPYPGAAGTISSPRHDITLIQQP